VFGKMNDLFKTKLTYERAVNIYMSSLSQIINSTYENDIEYLHYFCDEDVILITDTELFKYEMVLAVIALELEAVRNLKPSKLNGIIRCLRTLMEDDEYAIHQIFNIYIPQISEVKSEGSLPDEGVLSSLLINLDIEFDRFIAAAFSELLYKKVGGWKTLLRDYRIS